MKKLLAIICVLLVILVGMYLYKTNLLKSNITAQEVEKIEEYISKIYMWQEITEEALPQFDNINNASDIWIWEVVKKNLENYELTYGEIQEKAIEIFGKDFKKQFSKEGSEYIKYQEDIDKYFATGIGLDTLEDMFFIKSIKRTNKGYQVEIVEYLEDYSQAMNIEAEDEIYDIYIKRLNHETVATIKSSEGETRAIEVVKENIEAFTEKTMNLVKDSEGRIYIESVRHLGQS